MPCPRWLSRKRTARLVGVRIIAFNEFSKSAHAKRQPFHAGSPRPRLSLAIQSVPSGLNPIIAHFFSNWQ
jgi:hypothetical protein